MSVPLRLLVSYDGTKFSGFQIQPDQRTVQGTLEDALSRVSKQPVRIVAAGRTDAGVHALGQVVSIAEPGDLTPDTIMRAMPSLLPSDVAVVDAQLGPEGFDARFSAQWRGYTYLIWNAEAPNPLHNRFSLWVRDRIDVVSFGQAMRKIVGTHDFSSFGRLRSDQTPERRIIESTVVADGQFLRVRVIGEAFLHQMVRSLVGSALEVGLGRKPVSFMSEALLARSRQAAGPVAPPHGLALVDVGYKDVSWPRRQPTLWPWSDRVVAHSERGTA